MTVVKIKQQKAQRSVNLKKTQLENKINYLEKNKIDMDSIKEFIKNNKSVLKIKQRFKK